MEILTLINTIMIFALCIVLFLERTDSKKQPSPTKHTEGKQTLSDEDIKALQEQDVKDTIVSEINKIMRGE